MIWFLLAVILVQPLVAVGWFQVGKLRGLRIADQRNEADMEGLLDAIAAGVTEMVKGGQHE
jgi:hypothetical protein